MVNATTTLPRIVRFISLDDCPESSCPHCGATGRWIHTFQVEDGRRLAAMSGCVKLFPVSQIAQEEARLVKKAADYVKHYGPGARLNARDTGALAAIEEFYAGTRDERSALSVVRGAKQANQAKYRRR